MRRTLLLLWVPSLAASAQPVIQYANLTPNGTSFALHLGISAGTSDPLPNGANVTWDFSSATLQMNVGTMTWVDPASTPQGASFPASNKAQKVVLPSGTTYNYFNAQPTQLDQLADGVGSGGEDIYTDPKTPLIFPFNYQDSYVDTYNDGTPESTTRSYTGYGTVILPTGTYTNVVKMTNSSGDITFLTSDPVAQLLSIDDDGTVIVFGDPVSGVAEQGGAPTLQAFPNPATDRLTVTGMPSAGIWELVDAEGRVQQKGQAVPGMMTLPMEGMAQGCYALIVRDGNGSKAVRVVKQ